MTDAAAPRPVLRRAIPPQVVGLGSLVAFFLSMELLIQTGVINRFIVPPPSDIVGSFGRVIVEENVFGRFLLTLSECLIAGVLLTVVGVGGGVLMHRFKLLQQACETWVAAMASAPIVLMYPLFLVIFGRSMWTMIMMGFVAALPPVILKTLEGLSEHPQGAGQCRPQLQPDAVAAVLENPVSRPRCRPFSSASASG